MNRLPFRALLLLLLALPAARAGEGDPLVFFRDPDPKTKRRIEDLASAKGIGDGDRAKRRRSRAELKEIGYWTVPFLADAVTGRKASERVRMNAALTLARLNDKRGLPALAAGARKDGHDYVRLACCLALGLYRDKEPLADVLQDRRKAKLARPAAALALVKTGREAIDLYREIKAKDPGLRAAILIASAILDPEIKLAAALGDNEKVVRRAAATALLIRPRRPTQKAMITDRLAREKDPELRALLYHALGAVGGMEQRKMLLDAATKTHEKAPARIAAAIELGQEYGVTENGKALLSALKRVTSRNDPLAGPLIFALTQTNDKKAIEKVQKLVGGQGDRAFYAAGSLVHLICNHPDKESATRLEDFGRLDKPALQLIVGIAGKARYENDRKKWAELARGEFKKIRDPRRYHLWDWSREDRAWAKVNQLLGYIFKLDDVTALNEMDAPETPLKQPEGGGGPARGGASAKPEELDLIDFLKKPYFGPADLVPEARRGG